MLNWSLYILLVYGLCSHPKLSLDGLVQGLEFVRGRECFVGLSILLGYVLTLNLALIAWCRGWSLAEQAVGMMANTESR